MNYFQWLRYASQSLMGSESPKRDAEILLSTVTKRNRTYLMAFSETDLSEKELTQLEMILQRRKNGEPIAYITNEKEFWSLPLKVSPFTLIPRPDTERLVELALERLPDTVCDVLDLGTGTGAIALAIASERPDCRVLGVDLLEPVVELAQENARKLRINNVTFLQSNWFEQLKKFRFSMIVSNPPYIDEHDPHLVQGDVRFEPKSALVAPEKGLAEIRHIIEQSVFHLEQYGWLLIEHGWAQADDVQILFRQQGFQLVETFTDYGGNDRVTLGRWFAS